MNYYFQSGNADDHKCSETFSFGLGYNFGLGSADSDIAVLYTPDDSLAQLEIYRKIEIQGLC
jgi:hypothetical protein